MSRCPTGFSLLEMLVVLAIVGILGVTVVVPQWDQAQRRRELVADDLAVAIAGALRRSRAGEDWQLAWSGGRLRLWRPGAGEKGERTIDLPAGTAIRALAVDGRPWPEERPLALRGFSTPPLRLELDLGTATVTLQSSPIGRVERLAEAGTS